jgi:hypothetical protein
MIQTGVEAAAAAASSLEVVCLFASQGVLHPGFLSMRILLSHSAFMEIAS